MKKILLSVFAVLAVANLTLRPVRADAALHGTGGPVTMFVKSTPGPGPSDINDSSSPSTLLWDARFGNPATAPDGHQLTLAEWTRPEPSGTARCLGDCTQVNLRLTGLIPNGVYTLWVLVFDGPFGVSGPGKPAPFGHLVGVGSLGANDGSQNSFRASRRGDAHVNVVMPPGPLSSAGPPFVNNHYDLKGCLLDEVEFHIVGVYHFDGQTYGPEPGFEHGGAEQFGIPFQPHRIAKTSQVITTPPSTDPVYDSNGNAPRKNSPLYTDTSGMCSHLFPITAPDGSAIKLQQWTAVKGSAKIDCSPAGTAVTLKLRNLIPNGVYTIWVLGLKSPGITPDFANLLGVDALGPPDGSQNAFVASPKGEAELTAFNEAGPYSDLDLGNMAPACLLDLFEFQLLGAYHPDGQTHGGHPGDPCTFTVQFGFDFTQSNLPPDPGAD